MLGNFSSFLHIEQQSLSNYLVSKQYPTLHYVLFHLKDRVK